MKDTIGRFTVVASLCFGTKNTRCISVSLSFNQPSWHLHQVDSAPSLDSRKLVSFQIQQRSFLTLYHTVVFIYF